MSCSIKLPFVFSLAMLLLLPANAQQSASPTKNEPQSSGIILKTTSNLVVVDVVVTDSHHNPIHDLRPSDFTLEESNTTQ